MTCSDPVNRIDDKDCLCKDTFFDNGDLYDDDIDKPNHICLPCGYPCVNCLAYIINKIILLPFLHYYNSVVCSTCVNYINRYPAPNCNCTIGIFLILF